MTWAAQDKERRRNQAEGDRLLNEAWERAYLCTRIRGGGHDCISQAWSAANPEGG